jgi:hypothetical protein
MDVPTITKCQKSLEKETFFSLDMTFQNMTMTSKRLLNFGFVLVSVSIKKLGLDQETRSRSRNSVSIKRLGLDQETRSRSQSRDSVSIKKLGLDQETRSRSRNSVSIKRLGLDQETRSRSQSRNSVSIKTRVSDC